MRTQTAATIPLAEKLVTHRFALANVMKAYDTFENAARESALKVILKTEPTR